MSFDRLARHYRWMELVLAGEKLQRCRTAFLSDVVQSRDILILGEGNGRFLLACREAIPSGQITCVDASARMLELAADRLKRNGMSADGVRFVQADVLSLTWPASSFDLIVTHFFLDCFPGDQLETLVAGLAGSAKPGAKWLLADFQVPQGGLRRWRALVIHWAMYRFFRLATRLPARRLTPPEACLNSGGFVLRRRLTREWGLLHSDLWEHARPSGLGLIAADHDEPMTGLVAVAADQGHALADRFDRAVD